MDGAPSKRLLQRQPFWHSPYEEPDAGAGAVHTITVMPATQALRAAGLAGIYVSTLQGAADRSTT